MSPFSRFHGRGRGHPGAEFGADRGPNGGRRGRLFDHGQMKLLVLRILAAGPSHGYDVIRAIADAVGGDYSPSPGTIYPTLTLLEDLGFATSSALADGRRQYRITEAGQAHLAESAAELALLSERLAEGQRNARARRVPEIARAMENLKTALRFRFAEGKPTDESVQRIAAIIDRAAVEIGSA